AAAGALTGLGAARAGDVGVTTLDGRSVAAGDVVVKFTYRGDANLDGKINIDDYVRIDAGIANDLTGWSNGDFNLDGKVNIDDYVVIDTNVTIQGPPLSNGI